MKNRKIKMEYDKSREVLGYRPAPALKKQRN